MFVPHASKIWTKSYGPNYTKILNSLTKNGLFKTIIWQSVGTILEDVSVAETIV